jgi:hypothetical protein
MSSPTASRARGRARPSWALALLGALGCAPAPGTSPVEAPVAAPAPSAGPPTSEDARDRFFATIASLCGRRFEGRTIYMIEPSEPFHGAALAMEVDSCDEREIRIPFVVGEERSRTWVLTRSEDGLLLEHDHRHDDGTPEDVTNYGGWATRDGSENRQRFPAHEPTARMIPDAATNVWTLELRPSEGVFVYDLDRHDAPRFRAHFAIDGSR